jgi:hypothetical protein
LPFGLALHEGAALRPAKELPALGKHLEALSGGIAERRLDQRKGITSATAQPEARRLRRAGDVVRLDERERR